MSLGVALKLLVIALLNVLSAAENVPLGDNLFTYPIDDEPRT